MIFIVNGAPGSGKTTFESKVKTIMGNYCMILSTVDFVKEVATKCGWDGTKTLENRKFLSDLKRLLTEWNDVPVNKIKEQIEKTKSVCEHNNIDFERLAIFIDCREPEEIKRLCKELNAQSILVCRESAQSAPTSNKSDKEVLNYCYDILINNNEDMINLCFEAIDFVNSNELYKIISKPSVNLFGEIE